MREEEDIIKAARIHCQKRGGKLTKTREEILRLVLSYPYVVKAYDLLAELQKRRKTAAPPTVYRALDFLINIGILHRTESLNGYVFCPDFEHEHQSLITSCQNCGKTTEYPAAKEIHRLIQFCHQKSFALSPHPIVLSGLCQNCQTHEEEHAAPRRPHNPKP